MGGKQDKVQATKIPTANEVKTFIMVSQMKWTWYRNKKVEWIKNKKNEICNYLKQNNLDIAKAKMDTLIREEDYITVYDILGPLLEILKEKVTYLMSQPICPSDLRAPLDTIIYASTRMEVDDWHKLREWIGSKYGQLYWTKSNENADSLVNINVIEKLKVKPVDENILIIRLKQWTKERGINYEFPCEVLSNPFESNNDFGGNQVVNPYQSAIAFEEQGQQYPGENNFNAFGNYNNGNDLNNYGGLNQGGQVNNMNNNPNNNGFNPYQNQGENNFGGFNPNQNQGENNFGGFNPNQNQGDNNFGGFNPNQNQGENNNSPRNVNNINPEMVGSKYINDSPTIPKSGDPSGNITPNNFGDN